MQKMHRNVDEAEADYQVASVVQHTVVSLVSKLVHIVARVCWIWR